MDQTMWAIGRGSGLTALAFLTLSVLLGILTRSGRPLPGLPRFAVQSVHRAASLIGVALVGVHLLSLLADPLAQLRLVDFVVPFLGLYRPFWQGLGTIAFDLLLLVTITGLLRNRIGPRTFRLIHWAAYALWPIALAHGLGNGTDAGEESVIALAVGATIAVTAAVAWRLRANFIEFSKVRTAERISR